jgi:hypothetical protein
MTRLEKKLPSALEVRRYRYQAIQHLLMHLLGGVRRRSASRGGEWVVARLVARRVKVFNIRWQQGRYQRAGYQGCYTKLNIHQKMLTDHVV